MGVKFTKCENYGSTGRKCKSFFLGVLGAFLNNTIGNVIKSLPTEGKVF